MNGNAYIDDMLNMRNEDNEFSEVSEFYSGRNVLITGASGFIGKLLIDKLLRTCPKLGTIYILMRPKKGKTALERLKFMFENEVFDRLSREQPNFINRVTMVEGDTGEIDLGLSPEARDMLIKNTHIILHGAATVRFDETLRKVVNINVRGVKLMLLLAKEMPNLKAFVHLSTAYSNCPFKHIEEKYYNATISADKVMSLVDLLDDDMLDHLKPKVLGPWPNTYALSKTLGENVVRQYGTGIPTCIVRPSIVLSTKEEPICGWIDNIYGATGVYFGAYLCVLRALHCNSRNVAEIIPADYVVNNVIVAAWDIDKTWNAKSIETIPRPLQSSKIEEETEPPIYNCVTSAQNPLTWEMFRIYNTKHGRSCPTIRTFYYHIFIMTKYKWWYNILVLFLHFIPATILDMIARLTGRKPMLLAIYQKIHRFTGVIAYFCTNEWKFENQNVLKLWEKTNAVDRKTYDFNVANLDWDSYFRTHVRGIRVYILKDPMSTVDKALRRYIMLMIIHHTFLTLIFLLVAWAFRSFIRSMYL